MTTDSKNRHWPGWVGVAAVMLALVAASAALSAPAPTAPGITILPSPLAPGTRVPANGVTFHALSCRHLPGGRFHAVGRSGSWKLVIQIRPFSGYRKYEIEYGDDAVVDFDVYGPSNPPGFGFSNQQEPPTDQRRLTIGGGLAFLGGRSRLYLGFPFTYDGRYPRPGVARVLGIASCRYPGQRG